jgi:hypothetical protein
MLRDDRARRSGQTPDILRRIHRHERFEKRTPVCPASETIDSPPPSRIDFHRQGLAQLRASGRTGSGFLRERCTRTISAPELEDTQDTRKGAGRLPVRLPGQGHAPPSYGPMHDPVQHLRLNRARQAPVRVDPPSSRWARLPHPRMSRTPLRITVLGGCCPAPSSHPHPRTGTPGTLDTAGRPADTSEEPLSDRIAPGGRLPPRSGTGTSRIITRQHDERSQSGCARRAEGLLQGSPCIHRGSPRCAPHSAGGGRPRVVVAAANPRSRSCVPSTGSRAQRQYALRRHFRRSHSRRNRREIGVLTRI